MLAPWDTPAAAAAAAAAAAVLGALGLWSLAGHSRGAAMERPVDTAQHSPAWHSTAFEIRSKEVLSCRQALCRNYFAVQNAVPTRPAYPVISTTHRCNIRG
jgi:hypothetical protein